MVVYSRAHYVFRAIGHFGSSPTNFLDHWSSGFRLGLVGGDVPVGVPLEPFLETVYTAIQAFHTSGGAKAGTNCFLDELTIARVGLDGKYDPPAQETTRRAYASPPIGSGTTIHPWNTAMVISLRTPFPRGIASNGRTYWPTTAMPIDGATGRVAQDALEAYVAAAKTMIQAINAASQSQIATGVVVTVQGQDGKTGPARAAAVTSIRSDGRLDTIERRENDQPSSYTVELIP